MKKSNLFKSILLGIIVVFSSCTDLTELNINPNEPTKPEASYLLTNTLYTIGNQTATNGFTFSSTLMQYHGKFDFNDVDQYEIETNSAVWVTNYKVLADMNDVINGDKTSTSTKAVAKILKAVIGAELTDLYGPVPFFEAGDKNNLTPKYDQQKEIYTATNGVLDLLSTAVSTLSTDNSAIVGDIMFSGERERWIKLANVLQLRYLLRVSSNYPAAATKIQQIVASGNIFSSNTDNAILSFQSEPNHWFLSKVRDGDFSLYSITTTVLKMLKDKDDPRLAFYFKPNDAGNYVGIVPGSNDRAGNYTGLSSNLRAADVLDMVFITYYEQEFILAEAALKGYITSNAQQHYENAIKANFNYKKITLPSDYLSNTSKGLWKGTLENIINQKYLANIMSGHEAWFDYRRTGFPTLNPALNNSNSDKIPVRFKYPTEETFTNKRNNSQALGWLNSGNDYNSKSWWDK
ncbi:SusD/RagB family nutrient-binding outer membrane lipoprotein [uncultured Tenacibaculum sp.]|uniref:SusD/RagB family nutrient-binding outer membrane lipoprotein n=1 Tax=uncultured Tenacibaculum sp. TaxID=174713 RepID=UPI0026250D6D|nr:SusD/RagB family nutrient-binding outer membrane lipoprotein [uncultured Tenacibaculum sp.]